MNGILYMVIATTIYCVLLMQSLYAMDWMSSILFGVCFGITLGWTLLKIIGNNLAGGDLK